MVTGIESAVEPLMSLFLFNALTVWPFWRIYRRAGLPGWWSLSALIPFIGLVAVIAIIGHARWPNLPARTKPLPPKARRELPQAEG